MPLGIIPAGSGNGLAAELGVDRRPELAIAKAVRATPSRMDMGALGGRLFVNLAGIGIRRARRVPVQPPGQRGRGFVNYLRLGVGAIVSYVPAWYTITTGDVRLSVRAVLVVVANSVQYGNGAKIAPGARLDDGELDLVVVEERWRIATFCRTPRLFTGSLARAGGCSIRRIREATIECAEPMIFHVDGEPIAGGTRLEARVHPGALDLRFVRGWSAVSLRTICRVSGSLTESSRSPRLLTPRSRQPDDARFADRGDAADFLDCRLEHMRGVSSSSTFTTPMAPAAPRPRAKLAMLTPWRPRMVPTSPITPG